jgi:hypothetical protein
LLGIALSLNASRNDKLITIFIHHNAQVAVPKGAATAQQVNSLK